MTLFGILILVGLGLAGVGVTALFLGQLLVAIVCLWLAATCGFLAWWSSLPRDPDRWLDDD